MATLTIPRDTDLTIPAEELKAAGLHPGDHVMLIRRRGHLEIVPIPTIADLQGAAPGINSDFSEEREREWRN